MQACVNIYVHANVYIYIYIHTYRHPKGPSSDASLPGLRFEAGIIEPLQPAKTAGSSGSKRRNLGTIPGRNPFLQLQAMKPLPRHRSGLLGFWARVPGSGSRGWECLSLFSVFLSLYQVFIATRVSNKPPGVDRMGHLLTRTNMH